jgi:hypothetical protein
MSNNKYSSITETFISDPLLDVLMSSLATPPADLVLSNADFGAGVGKPIYWRTTVSPTGRRPDFTINDVPRLKGYGLFCNIADGLVLNDTVMTPEAGLILALTWNSYTTGGVVSQTNFTGGATQPQFSARILALNHIYPADFAWDFSSLNINLASIRGIATVVVGASNSKWATVSVDPAYANKRLIFWPVFILEHTFPIIEANAV